MRKSVPFKVSNFYKIIESGATPLKQPKDNHKRALSMIVNDAQLNSNYKYGKLRSSLQKDREDIISVIGKRNPIKENAYSDVNVDVLPK